MCPTQAFYACRWANSPEPRSDILRSTSLKEILLIIEKQRIAQHGKLDCVVNALHRLGTLARKYHEQSTGTGIHEKELPAFLLALLADRLDFLRSRPQEAQSSEVTWGAMHTSKVLCACAKLQLGGIVLPPSLGDLARALVEDLVHVGVGQQELRIAAHTCWALAHLVGSSPAAAHRMWATGLSRRTTVGSLPLEGYEGRIGKIVAERAAGAWVSMQTAEIAMITWTLARLVVQDKLLYSDACNAARSQLDKFQVSEISNMMWAFATVGIEEPTAFFDDLQDEVEKRASYGKELKELVHVAWAYAALSKMSYDRVYASVADCISAAESQRPLGVEFRLLALLTWTLGKSQNFHQRLFSVVRDRFISEAAFRTTLRVSVRDISTCCYGFAAFAITDSSFCNALAELVIKADFECSKFVAQDVLFILSCLEHSTTSSDAKLYAALAPRVTNIFRGKLGGNTDPDGANGGWLVVMLTALKRHEAHCADTDIETLEVLFRNRVYEPVVSSFNSMVKDARGLEVVRSHVARLKLDHFGPIYSIQVLRDLCLHDDTTDNMKRNSSALRCIEDALASSGETHHVASQRLVLAWAEYCIKSCYSIDVEVDRDESQTTITQGSFLQQYVLANDTWWEEVEDFDRLLKPIRAKHGRSGHAERAALIQILRKVPRRCAHLHKWGSHLTGSVWIFVTRWPCTSCLAVFCQWRHVFPNVHLSVSFDERGAGLLEEPSLLQVRPVTSVPSDANFPIGMHQRSEVSASWPTDLLEATCLPGGRFTYYGEDWKSRRG